MKLKINSFMYKRYGFANIPALGPVCVHIEFGPNRFYLPSSATYDGINRNVDGDTKLLDRRTY